MDLAVEACAQAGLSPVVVVLGAARLGPLLPTDSRVGAVGEVSDDAEVSAAGNVGAEGGVGVNAEVRLLHNPDWATGIASSLRAGLTALESDRDIDAVVVTLVDTPCVNAEHLRRIGLSLRDGATAAVATYEGQARTPVGLTREVWADVARTVAGDEGARRWLRLHPHLVTDVECADLGFWTDIDTPADLPD